VTLPIVIGDASDDGAREVVVVSLTTTLPFDEPADADDNEPEVESARIAGRGSLFPEFRIWPSWSAFLTS
jgi:hypothetical protein